MPFWVYILRSETTGRHYCGSTSDVERRLRQHNDPDYRLSKTTKRFQGPWALLWSQECITRGESMHLERQVKKRGVSRYLLDIQQVESRKRQDPREPFDAKGYHRRTDDTLWLVKAPSPEVQWMASYCCFSLMASVGLSSGLIN